MLPCPVHEPRALSGRPRSNPAALSSRRHGVTPGLSALTWTLLLVDPVAAQSPPSLPDKNRYHVFHPTPRELMRELETDRPDQTESPITVDAGHFQVEADLLSYAETRRDGIRRQGIVCPALNLKIGLLNQVDLQVVLQPYGHVRVEDRTTSPASVSTHSGFGDMQVRSKLNLWGNDGGDTALAVMPFLHLPTGAKGLTTDAVEGGVIFPFSVDLPATIMNLTMMWEVDWVRDWGDGGYHAEFVQSLTASRSLTKRVLAYVEFYTVVSTDTASDWIGMFDFGLNYLVHGNLKFDAGLNIGVTESAPDWAPFIGVTWRY